MPAPYNLDLQAELVRSCTHMRAAMLHTKVELLHATFPQHLYLRKKGQLPSIWEIQPQLLKTWLASWNLQQSCNDLQPGHAGACVQQKCNFESLASWDCDMHTAQWNFSRKDAEQPQLMATDWG